MSKCPICETKVPTIKALRITKSSPYECNQCHSKLKVKEDGKLTKINKVSYAILGALSYFIFLEAGLIGTLILAVIAMIVMFIIALVFVEYDAMPS